MEKAFPDRKERVKNICDNPQELAKQCLNQNYSASFNLLSDEVVEE